MSIRNIVLITIDCLRYDRCGFNGYARATTPTLSRLAGQSTVYDRCFASGPYTPESFTGILAGRSGRNSPYLGDRALSSLGEDTETLASELGEQGYSTLAVVSNPQLSVERGFSIGFDHFENLRTDQTTLKTSQAARNDSTVPRNESVDSQDNEPVDNISSGATGSSDPWQLLNPSKLFRNVKDGSGVRKSVTWPMYAAYRYWQMNRDWPTVSGERVVTRFCSALKDHITSADEGTPKHGIFAWTHLNDLHAPIHPARVRAAPLAPDGGTLQYFKWDAERAIQRDRGAYPRLYDACLRYVDSQIARLIDALQEMGIWDETALVITSDHGEAFCERGVWGHQQHYLYDEVLHVPLLVRTPAGKNGRTDANMSLAWTHELVTDLLGEARLEFPATSGVTDHTDESEPRLVVSDSITRHGHTVAVRDTEYKYLKHFNVADENTPERVVGGLSGEEMYHIRSDVGEHNPIPSELAPEELIRMADAIQTKPNDLVSLNESGPLDADRKKQLQDLGYLN